MPVKADRTKLLLKVINTLKYLREGSCSLLEIEIEKQFVRFPPEIMPCHVLAVGVLEITIILKGDSGIQIFLNGDVLLNGS